MTSNDVHQQGSADRRAQEAGFQETCREAAAGVDRERPRRRGITFLYPVAVIAGALFLIMLAAV